MVDSSNQADQWSMEMGDQTVLMTTMEWAIIRMACNGLFVGRRECGRARGWCVYVCVFTLVLVCNFRLNRAKSSTNGGEVR